MLKQESFKKEVVSILDEKDKYHKFEDLFVAHASTTWYRELRPYRRASTREPIANQELYIQCMLYYNDKKQTSLSKPYLCFDPDEYLDFANGETIDWIIDNAKEDGYDQWAKQLKELDSQLCHPNQLLI